MSLGALARALSLSTPFVRAVELGHSPLPRGRAVDFARVLHLPVADLAEVDQATLAVTIDALTAAGGCDRAVAIVEELAKGPHALAPSFDAVGAVLSYLRARGSAPEDDILTMLAAREEEHLERHETSVHGSAAGASLCAVRLLADLVTAGRLRWRDAPGKKGDPSAPLIYSIAAREKRRSLDTRMGCVERAVERRRAGA